jgi:hypothetical protein
MGSERYVQILEQCCLEELAAIDWGLTTLTNQGGPKANQLGVE